MRIFSQFWVYGGLLFLSLGCVESSGGELSSLPGLDIGPSGCGEGADCPAGSVCHPSGVCVQCPGGRCSGDAGGPPPPIDGGLISPDLSIVRDAMGLNDAGDTPADRGLGSDDMHIEEPTPDASMVEGDASSSACDAEPEVCNGADDDCDSLVDEDFDLNTDVLNCGVCGLSCTYPNGMGVCVDGDCSLQACTEGYRDDDGLEANGCEFVENRLELLSPGHDDALNQDFTIRIRIRGVDSIGHVEFRAGAELLARRAPMENMSIEVSIAEFEEGPQTIMVSVFDFDGVVLERIQSNLIIDRTPPTVSVLQPADDTIQGAVPFDLFISVVDTAQPVRLSGRFGDFELPVLNQAPYAYRIDPLDIGSGTRQLQLEGIDRAGNRTDIAQNFRLSFCAEDAVAHWDALSKLLDTRIQDLTPLQMMQVKKSPSRAANEAFSLGHGWITSQQKLPATPWEKGSVLQRNGAGRAKASTETPSPMGPATIETSVTVKNPVRGGPPSQRAFWMSAGRTTICLTCREPRGVDR